MFVQNSFINFPRIPYFKDGVSVGNFDSSANWQELSGLCAPTLPVNKDYMWLISDAPANILACVDLTGANKGVWTLTGATAGVDWEDLESARVNGVSYLYVMDYGNNNNVVDSRGTAPSRDMRILRIVEPTITGSNGSTANFIEIECVFPGGADAPTLRDCEATIVDPATGDIYIITKREAVPGVYFLPHAATYSGVQTLTYLGKMFDIPDVTTSALGATAVNVVDACISPDGREILVKNYNNIYYFKRRPRHQTIYNALIQTPTTITYVGGGSVSPAKSHPNAEPQGEGISFDYYGKDLYSHSEFLSTAGSTSTRYPFFKYERVSKVPRTVVMQEGVSPTAGYAGTLDTYVWDTNPTTSYGTEATIVADTAAGVETDQRFGLLKFNFAGLGIQAVEKAVKAQLDLFINTEGAGWVFYKMDTDWNESSTYNSIGGATTITRVLATQEEGRNGSNLAGITGSLRHNMNLKTVQSWIDGSSPNYGWLIKCTDVGGNGVQFRARTHATAADRPKLTLQLV